MTPDVVVDIGNSRIKWGRVRDGRVTDFVALSHAASGDWERQRAEWRIGPSAAWAVAGVNPSSQTQFAAWASGAGGRVVELHDYRSVPLKLAVESPEQTGIDRLLSALAAWSHAGPRPVVVFTIGTAVTADVVDETGTFRGGAILPGPQLMARALHEHTAKLPLIDATNLHTLYCPGRNTERAIELGIGTAVGAAIRELYLAYTRLLNSPPVVFFTGGGMGPFTDVDPDEMWTPDPEDTRFAPTLTLDGIRLAAEALP